MMKIKNRMVNSVDPDETARYGLSHLDLDFLRKYLAWSAGLNGLFLLFSFLLFLNLCLNCRCYQMGIKLDPLKLVPLIHFPVPSGTPMISPHVKWDHTDTRKVPQDTDFERGSRFDFDLSQGSEDIYLTDHKVDGRILVPGASYLLMVWKALASKLDRDWEEMPVMFEDVNLFKATVLTEGRMYLCNICYFEQ